MKYKPFLLSTALLFMAAVGLWAEPVIQASAISGHEGTYSLGDEVVFNVTFTNTTAVVVAQEGVTTEAEANAQNQANTAKEFTVTGFLVGFDIYGNAVEVPVRTSGGNEVAPASTLEIQGTVMIPTDGTFHRLTDGGDSIVLYYTYTHTPVGGAAIIVGSGGADGSGEVAISRIIELQGDLDFGNVPVGDSVLRSLIIRNVGTSELSVSGLALPAGFSGTWAGVIAPGEQQQVEVRFSPTLKQLYWGRVSVLSNKTSGANALLLRGTGLSAETTWYSGASNLLDGWRYFDWFKGFKPEGNNWIYHGRQGWLYVLGEDTNGLFLWDGALGRWMFTSETIYPWMYAYGADGGWVFFFEGGRPGSRYFKRGDTGQTLSEQQLRVTP